MSSALKRFLIILVSIAMVVSIIACVFIGYIPEKYGYTVGSIALNDIYASRDVADNDMTRQNAETAKSSVPPIMVRDEKAAEINSENISKFFKILRQSRSNMQNEFGTPISSSEAEALINDTRNSIINDIGVEFDTDDIKIYVKMMTYEAFSYIEDKAISVTNVLMMDLVDEDGRETMINDQAEMIFTNNNNFLRYKSLFSKTLWLIIKPNTVFDLDATNEAAENAYNQVMNDPVIITKGTKIVSNGQIITEHDYQILKDLELIAKDNFDFVLLIRSTLYVIIVSVIMFVYYIFTRNKRILDFRMFMALCLVLVITVIASLYASDLSTNAITVLFFTTICAAFLGTSDGLILSVFLMFYMWPIYNFDTQMFVISLVAVVICSTLSGRNKNDNPAALIICTGLSTVAASLVYNFLSGATQSNYINSLLWASISSLICVVAAIGLMPLFELLSGAVTPVKLIMLSQQSQPLLKRLFIEAPGTSQHSMMVANLADSAADAIGADALLCKVASYFHDIGKLENPGYFTENQKDYNPHDVLTPYESAQIITAHTQDGVKIAQKNKLPKPIIDIIDQHHGNTYPSYFYKKAVEEAKFKGIEPPDPKTFCYKGKIPQTKEAAIVMLADTCEAAVKSIKSSDIVEVEKMIRNLIKKKIEDDQLSNSGLSFDDLEKIIKAFLNVYSGQFHERIKYPE